MTSPYYHAQSTARIFRQGSAQDFMPVHQHLDATKITYADARHRALRHNSLHLSHMMLWPGISSQYQGISLSDVCKQHCMEDCAGRVPTPSDWVSHFVIGKKWQNSALIDADSHAQFTAKKYGGEPKDYLSICQFLMRYVHHAQTHHYDAPKQYRLFTHHSQGVFDAEAVFGAVITNSRKKAIPTRYIAENLVKNELGIIPTVSMWLEDIAPSRWMSKGTHITSALPQNNLIQEV